MIWFNCVDIYIPQSTTPHSIRTYIVRGRRQCIIYSSFDWLDVGRSRPIDCIYATIASDGNGQFRNEIEFGAWINTLDFPSDGVHIISTESCPNTHSSHTQRRAVLRSTTLCMYDGENAIIVRQCPAINGMHFTKIDFALAVDCVMNRSATHLSEAIEGGELSYICRYSTILDLNSNSIYLHLHGFIWYTLNPTQSLTYLLSFILYI